MESELLSTPDETKKGVSTYRLQHGVCSWFGSETLTKTGWELGALYQAGPGGRQHKTGAARKVGRERRAEERVVTGHTDTSGDPGAWSGGMSVIIKLIGDIRIA